MPEEEVANGAAAPDNEERLKRAPESESLSQQLLAQTRQELGETKDRYMRALADLANLKKRMAQENRDARTMGTISILEDLLPILDNFERALQALEDSGEAAALKDGVVLIYNQLRESLKKKGLRPIEAVGQPFDPYFHEAAGRVPTDEVEEGHIVNEILRGYIFGERVVRPSRVTVATKPEPRG